MDMHSLLLTLSFFCSPTAGHTAVSSLLHYSILQEPLSVRKKEERKNTPEEHRAAEALAGEWSVNHSTPVSQLEAVNSLRTVGFLQAAAASCQLPACT